ncbi:hypothetical protein C8Q75DRAFT_801065 [Abortiporus biennis]|nr:hypothetical protein C8Q75DRAFT_801065 [Abortiporus biennis]
MASHILSRNVLHYGTSLSTISRARRTTLLTVRNLSGFSPSQLSQTITLPNIPELYNPQFLDELIPNVEKTIEDIEINAIGKNDAPYQPMMDALKSTSNHTLTANFSPAFRSTLSPTLDAFNALRPSMNGDKIWKVLDKAWKEDPELTLKIIWNARSIHDGKNDREVFYQAFGWLFKNHPRTAIINLPLLVKPVCVIDKQDVPTGSHGYFKDLLNIITLAALDQFGPNFRPLPFFNEISEKRSIRNEYRDKYYGTPLREINQILEREAPERRIAKRKQFYEGLVEKLNAVPHFRALYVAVARIFAKALLRDDNILRQINALPDDAKAERIELLHKLSLAGKWAPTPGLCHDVRTNIATAIAQLVHYGCQTAKPNLQHDLSHSFSAPEAQILRSFYHRWFLVPLRRALVIPEPLMSANKWSQIVYPLVHSQSMQRNMGHFYRHDPERFGKYLLDVESGKKTITGATLLPHELLRESLSHYSDEHDRGKKQIADFLNRGIQAQWETMVERLRQAGTLDNSIAICDVSGSMGRIQDYMGRKSRSRQVQPILPALSLSILLAQVAKPPFNGGFITFSQSPEFVSLLEEGMLKVVPSDSSSGSSSSNHLSKTILSQSLFDIVTKMERTQWGMNTNFNAIFLNLILPLAKKHRIKQEDMVKRIFVFSDMQFDEAMTPQPSYVYDPVTGDATLVPPPPNAANWETNHDVVEKAYQEAGYEVPDIIYCNLATDPDSDTLPVTKGKKGVAVMSGFSPAMLKAFMGEEVIEDDLTVTPAQPVGKKKTEKVAMDPVDVMKKALAKSSFDGLVVVD